MKNGMKFLLVLTLIMSMSFTTFADTESNADLLAELNLLSGTGSSYALDNSLTRAEASTFIVKIMGEQSEVLNNPTSTSVFSDIKGNEWFVPYIAYCYNNGIVSGYPDGTFRPDKVVSEQEFLSMMLKALNITDTEWNMIHPKAYSTGLITVPSVDSNFLRGDVIDIMFNSLELPVNDTTNTVISRLVEKNVIEEDLAVEKGLMIQDEIKSDIKFVKAESNNEVIITMNEEIESVNVVITDESNNLIEVEKISVNKKTITVEVEELKEIEYTIILNEVVDELGIITNNLSMTFIGAPKVVESPYFHISSVKAISEQLVHVTFTHPITTNIAVPMNYDITLDGEMVVEGSFDTIKVDMVTDDEYTIALWLRDYTMLDGAPYKLTVDGDIKSKYLMYLNDGDSESFKFVGNGHSDDAIEIVEIDLIQEDYVRVRFNQRVNSASAKDNNNYSIYNDKIKMTLDAVGVYMTGSAEWENKEVTFKTLLDDNTEYEITINDIKDAFLEEEIPEEKYGFVDFPEFVEPEIEYALAINENFVQVYFTEAVDSDSLSVNNIRIGGAKPNKLLFDSNNPYKVELYMDADDKINSDETMTFVNLDTNYGLDFGFQMYEVEGVSKDVPDISIKKAERISDDHILVEFNYPISTSNSKSNFKIEYTDKDDDKQSDSVDSISYINNRTVVVKYSDIDNNTSYKVVVKNFLDITGQHTASETRRSVE